MTTTAATPWEDPKAAVSRSGRPALPWVVTVTTRNAEGALILVRHERFKEKKEATTFVRKVNS